MRSFRVVAAFAFTAFLAACGGGGSSPGGVTVPPPIPAPSATGLAQQTVQRSDTQSALTGVQTYEEIAGGGSIGTLTATRSAYRMLAKLNPRKLLSARRSEAGAACSNGEEETVSGTTITIEQFYDAACTEPEAEIVWTYTQEGDDYTGPATYTMYSTSGATTETADVQITFDFSSTGTLTAFAFLLTSIVDQGTQLGEAGVACAEGSNLTCGVAAIANVAALGSEIGANASATVNSSTSTVSMQVTDYQGAENALSLAQATIPNWTIAPASDQISSTSMTAQPTSTGFTLTLVDNTNGGTFAIAGSSSGTVTGTLTNNANGATVATFTIDAQGNGTLTYTSSGTTASIVNFVVQG